MIAPLPRKGFFATLGDLPGTWLTLAITVVAGMCEGLGLALFVPLLDILGEDGGKQGWGFRLLSDGFTAVGLPINLYTMLALILVLMVGSFTVTFAKDRMLAHAKYRHMEVLRNAVVDSLFLSRWSYLSRQASGEVINQAVTECFRGASGLTNQVMAVATAIQVVALAVVSSLLAWELLALCAMLAAVMALIVLPLHRRARAHGDSTSVANRNYSFHVIDHLRGARLIRVTGAEERELGRLARFNRTLIGVLRSAEVLVAFTYFVNQALPAVVLCGIIVVSYTVLDIPTSVLLTFLLIMLRLAPKLVQFQQYYQTYTVYAAALPVVDKAITEARASAEERGGGGTPFHTLEQRLRLDDVSFRYDAEGTEAVHRLSLTIPRNGIVGIVGESGAGKTTLIDLIAGLQMPDAGAVLVDGTDLRQMDLLTWRRRIGYVTQDVVVFNDTLRNNLLFSRPDAVDADIEAALATAQLADLAPALPQGLDTVLGEGGVRLSGGQKQRLALARALIGQPQLLLLDEATSSLDNESERRIQKAIDSIASKLTIVIVAHRLSTVRKANTIHVLEKGRIVESGTFDALLARNGRFAELHNAHLT